MSCHMCRMNIEMGERRLRPPITVEMTELPLVGGTTIWPQLIERSHHCLSQVVVETLRSERAKQARVYSQDVRFCRANAEPTEQYSGTPWQVCVHSSKEGVNVAAAAPSWCRILYLVVSGCAKPQTLLTLTYDLKPCTSDPGRAPP